MDTSILFSLQATGDIKLKKLREDESGDITYMMKMKKVNDNVTWFTDRPKREAGSGTLRELIESWDEDFKTSNPNSALSYIDENGNPDTIVFEQYRPKFNKRKGVLTSKITIHNDQILKDISSQRKNPLSGMALDARIEGNTEFDKKIKSGSLFIDNVFTKTTQVTIKNETNQTLLVTRLSQTEEKTDWGAAVLDLVGDVAFLAGCGIELLAAPARIVDSSVTRNKPKLMERSKSWINIGGGSFVTLNSLKKRANTIKAGKSPKEIEIIESLIDGDKTEGSIIKLGDGLNVGVDIGKVNQFGAEVELDVAPKALEAIEEKAISNFPIGKVASAMCVGYELFEIGKTLSDALRGSYSNGFYPIKKWGKEDDAKVNGKEDTEDKIFLEIPPKGDLILGRSEGDVFTKRGSKDLSIAVNILSHHDQKAMVPYGVFSFDNPAFGDAKAYAQLIDGFIYNDIEETIIYDSGEIGNTDDGGGTDGAKDALLHDSRLFEKFGTRVEYLRDQDDEFSGDKVKAWNLVFNGEVDGDALDAMAEDAYPITSKAK